MVLSRQFRPFELLFQSINGMGSFISLRFYVGMVPLCTSPFSNDIIFFYKLKHMHTSRTDRITYEEQQEETKNKNRSVCPNSIFLG